MKEILSKYKIEFIVAGYFIIVLLLVNFLAVPRADKIIRKSDMIQEEMLNSQIEEKKMGKIPEMEKSFNDYQSKKEALEVIFSSSQEFEIIKNIETIAQESGNSIVSLNVDDPAKKNPVPKGGEGKAGQEKSILESLSDKNYLSFRIALSGNYDSLVYFMQKIENSRHYMNIISASSLKEDESDKKKKEGSQNVFDSLASNRPDEEGADKKNTETDSQKPAETLLSDINLIVYTKK